MDRGSAVFPLQSLARAKAEGFRLSKMAWMPFLWRFFRRIRRYFFVMLNCWAGTGCQYPDSKEIVVSASPA
jgi:hypothetical protein